MRSANQRVSTLRSWTLLLTAFLVAGCQVVGSQLLSQNASERTEAKALNGLTVVLLMESIIAYNETMRAMLKGALFARIRMRVMWRVPENTENYRPSRVWNVATTLETIRLLLALLVFLVVHMVVL